MMCDLAAAVALFLREKGLSSVHETKHEMPEELRMYRNFDQGQVVDIGWAISSKIIITLIGSPNIIHDANETQQHIRSSVPAW